VARGAGYPGKKLNSVFIFTLIVCV